MRQGICLISRLPDGVGTRADICELIKDSAYTVENIPENQLNSIVSGALDRLHYEKDPCVKYDADKKLWIYLHKNRTIDFSGWKDPDSALPNNLENNSFNVFMKKPSPISVENLEFQPPQKVIKTNDT